MMLPLEGVLTPIASKLMVGAVRSNRQKGHQKMIGGLRHRLSSKIDRQGGIKTFFDSFLNSIIALAESGADSEKRDKEKQPTLEQLSLLMNGAQCLFDAERFVPYLSRSRDSKRRVEMPWEIKNSQMYAMQGVTACMQWRGLPLFKTVFEFALYPMILWDVKPRTIIELGSGTGASAVWLADISRSLGIRAGVISLDKRPPNRRHSNVIFLEGDCNAIDRTLTDRFLSRLPHPWVVVEDAHENIFGVLSYLLEFLSEGDYLIVEDSAAKVDDLQRLTSGTEQLAVDTRYTDFFGRNATCCIDSILVKGPLIQQP